MNEAIATVKQEFAQDVENMCKRRCEEEISNELEEEKRKKNLIIFNVVLPMWFGGLEFS